MIKIPIHEDWKEMYNSMIEKYGEKKGKEVFYATLKKHGWDETKPRPRNRKESYLNGIEFKEEGEELYAYGFVATDHVDMQGDYLPHETLNFIVNQINSSNASNKVSIHHDRADKTVIGKAVSAELKKTKDGHFGAFVKTHINKVHPEFEKIKYQIENGFIDGYSIEYIPEESHPIFKDGREVRSLDAVSIYGYGLASRPVNPNATITSYGSKELDYKELVNFFPSYDSAIQEKEMHEEEIECPECKKKMKSKEEKKKHMKDVHDKNMEEKKMEHMKEDNNTPAPELKEVKEVKEIEVKEKAEDINDFVEYKAFKEWKKSNEGFLKNYIAKQAARLQPSNMPLADTDNFMSPEKQIETNPELVNAIKEYKEAISSNFDIRLQYKAAAKLMNTAGPDAMMSRATGDARLLNPLINNWKISGNFGQRIEAKELGAKQMQFKANPLQSTTSQLADTSYYQAAAETADVYDAVIWNQTNLRSTFYGLLRKEDGSRWGYRYGFRVRIGGNTVSGAQAENVSTITPDSEDRLRLQQSFRYYYAGVAVTGQMIAAARAIGGIGDIFSEEIANATESLISTINQNLCTGTEDGFDDGNQVMGLPVLVEKGSTYTELYGVARATYATLKGNSEALSTENISKAQLRKMIRSVETGNSTDGGGTGGANINDCIFLMHHLQKDKILALSDDAQRIIGQSARIGFEGLPTFDGIPIFADKDVTNSKVYLIDMRHTFLVIQVAPTFTEWGNRYGYDQRAGFIKTYLNLVCTAPDHNYVTTGLKTT